MRHSFAAKQSLSYAAVRWCGFTWRREVILIPRHGGNSRRYKVLQAVTALKGYCNRGRVGFARQKREEKSGIQRRWAVFNELKNAGELLNEIVIASIALFFPLVIFVAIFGS